MFIVMKEVLVQHLAQVDEFVLLKGVVALQRNG